MIDKTDFDFFTEDHASRALALEQRIIATGQPSVGNEEKETWPDGRRIWWSTTKMPLRDDEGKIVGIFGIGRDITEQKERQLQMEAELELAREVQQSFLEMPETYFPSRAARLPVDCCKWLISTDRAGTLGEAFTVCSRFQKPAWASSSRTSWDMELEPL